MDTGSETDRSGSLNFLEQIVERDLERGAVAGVVTRFPPEPNGYLHLGHAMAVCLQFGIAARYGGRCHLRFDDTNPETEDMEYVRAAQRDIKWLGLDWGEYLYFASDYFEQLFAFAEDLIKKRLAYVDSLSEADIRTYRGTVTEAGRPSPYRDRSVDENLDLLRRMRDGEFAEGAHVLRARIDMASPNMLLRDPVLYRIKHAAHYRRGRDWCIYPLYDFAHPLSDAIEGITHSLCTLEFDVHRPLYDWLVDAVTSPPRPHQYEYARRNLEYTVVSKRKLLRLVREGHVDGWDDPRMPTIAGQRRRGVTPEAIKRFADLVGVAKSATRIDISLFEHAIRDDLNHRAPRVMAVLDPVRVTLSNWPADRVEWLEASHWPHDVPKEGTRKVPFSGTLYIDREDFRKDPPAKYHRLAPGREVRLRHGYVIRCDQVVHDAAGRLTELVCSYDPETRSGNAGSRRVKGTIHWVSAAHAVPAEFRLYDRLFRVPNPEDVGEGEDFLANLNPDSKRVVNGFVEHSLARVDAGDRFQFERQGYFMVDADSTADMTVYNRTITLRDTWAKLTATPAAPARRSEKPSRAPQIQEGPPIPTLTPDQQTAADRVARTHGLTGDDAAILASDPWLLGMFEQAAREARPESVANWVLHDVQRIRKAADEELHLKPEALSVLVNLVDDGAISTRIAKDLLSEVALTGGDPGALVRERGLEQIDDSASLKAAVDKVVSANPDKVSAYQGGKTGLIGFFMGQVMRETGGKANPETTRSLLEDALSG